MPMNRHLYPVVVAGTGQIGPQDPSSSQYPKQTLRQVRVGVGVIIQLRDGGAGGTIMDRLNNAAGLHDMMILYDGGVQFETDLHVELVAGAGAGVVTCYFDGKQNPA